MLLFAQVFSIIETFNTINSLCNIMSLKQKMKYEYFMDVDAPAQIITAPAQIITAPAKPPATVVAVCTALLLW